MKRTFPLVYLLFLVFLVPAVPAETVDITPPETETSPVSESLLREAEAAVQRGIDWLAANQKEDGSWSNSDFPALTALPLWGIALHDGSREDVINKAAGFILSTLNEDGSFCREPSEKRKGGGLCNYNTALSMTALHATGRPDYTDVILKARRFISQTQHFGDDIYHGGMGYDADTGRAYADLSNSFIAYEAMRLTENVEDLRKEVGERADLDWKAAEQFISSVQNRPESNDQTWASDEPDQYGGFAYKPDSSMAGAYTNEQGEIRLRSYGSMTYAGLLSFIYSDVSKADPRVQSAYEWSEKFWTLDENPGMDQQGLFYYYQTLAKALSAMGADVLETGEGRINWRTELIRKLVGIQKIEADGTGYWVNSEGRWWESDPVLVTAYTLLALHYAIQ